MSFYEGMSLVPHNGWYYLASGSLGLSPVEDFFFLDEEDWGVLDELGELPIDLKKSLAVFANGMGGYVCLEVNEKCKNSMIWWNDKAPRVGIDFWPVIDSWTAMGFEG